MAPKVGQVIAFEPSPQTFKTLLENIDENKLENVFASDYALWNKQEKITFYMKTGTGGDSLKLRKEAAKKTTEVYTITLDELYEKHFLAHRLDLVKLDIEGAELEALQGMNRTLQKFKPNLIIEIKPQYEAQVIPYLEGQGYKLTDRKGENHLFEHGGIP